MAKNWLPTTVLVCLALSFPRTTVLQAQKQGKSNLGSQSSGASSISSDAKNKKFAGQFWNYLLSNNYKNWSPVPGKTVDHFSAPDFSGQNLSLQSPHGTLLKTYMNRTAAGDPGSLPVGSVVIMENYRPDKSLQSISVMYRTKGFNPKANDWYWANYNPDGSVSSSADVPVADDQLITIDANGIEQTLTSSPTAPVTKLMGRATSCIQCHKQSGGSDLVFFNDDRQRPEFMASENSIFELAK